MPWEFTFIIAQDHPMAYGSSFWKENIYPKYAGCAFNPCFMHILSSREKSSRTTSRRVNQEVSAFLWVFIRGSGHIALTCLEGDLEAERSVPPGGLVLGNPAPIGRNKANSLLRGCPYMTSCALSNLK